MANPVFGIIAAACLLLICGDVILFFFHKESLFRQIIFIGLIISAGAAKFYVDNSYSSKDYITSYLNIPHRIWVSGSIDEVTHSREKDFYRFILHADSISYHQSSFRVNGDILITLPAQSRDSVFMDNLRPGFSIGVWGELVEPSGARNPGEFNYKHYLALNDIHAVFKADPFEQIRIYDTSGSSSFTGSIFSPIRSYIRKTIENVIGGVEGEFMLGLLIGDRTNIPDVVQQEFSDAGVSHVLAVSGLNVVFVSLIFLGVCSFLPIPRQWKRVIVLVALLFYMNVAGLSSSIIRATVMALCILGGEMIERKSNVLNSLGVSALIILMIDSRQLFDIGFELTYAAVLSLALFYPIISNYFVEKPAVTIVGKTMILVWQMVSVSVAAFIGTAPIIACYFNKASFISFFSNLIVVPASNFGLAIGVVVVFLSLVSSQLTLLYASLAKVLLFLSLKFIAFCASIRWLILYVPHLSPIFYFVYIIFLLCLYYVSKNMKRQKPLVTILLCANVIVYGWIVLHHARPADVRITFLDIGQGDAALLEFPDGKNIMIDTGGKTSNSDEGEKTIVPFLRREGIGILDAIILTHCHDDHSGGVLSILKNVHVNKVYMPGFGHASEFNPAIIHKLDNDHIEVDTLRAGMNIGLSPYERIYVLNPSPSFKSELMIDIQTGENNSSVVLKIYYGKESFLFMGDAGKEVEKIIDFSYGSFLHANVLKVGHHGSVTASSVEFLETVKPEYAVISVGATNRFHLPSPEIVDRLNAQNIKTFRTATRGGIIFEASQDSVWIAN